MSTPLHPHGAARRALLRRALEERAPEARAPEARAPEERAPEEREPTELAPLAIAADVEARSELAPEDKHLAWELVRQLGLSPTEAPGALALAALLLDALAGGSTRVSIAEPRAVLTRAAALGFEPATIEALTQTLGRLPEALVGPPGSRRPLVCEGEHLYVQRVFVTERRLVDSLRARLAAPSPPLAPGSILADLDARPLRRDGAALSLGEEQRAALSAALAEPLLCVSGGPGTGKTFIVVSLLRAAARAGLEPSAIAIAAPTGKAADRLRSSIEAGLRSIAEPPLADRRLLAELAPPRTLHRLLGRGRRPGEPRHHPGRPLPATLVLVDEASMVDLFLLTELSRALAPGARLVLLGDADQLPSVEAGAVFRDLCAAPRVPTATLSHSHRMDESQPAGRHILQVAADVNASRLATHGPRAVRRIETLPDRLDALTGVQLLEASALERERLLDLWLEQAVRGDSELRALARRTWWTDAGELESPAPLRRLLSHLERRRLLTLTRSAGTPTGLEAVNAALHRRYVALDRAENAAPGWLRAGEPVLVRRNDYERRLFNGDAGVVVFTAERSADTDRPRASAVFSRGERLVAHPLEAIRSSLDLAYATTVHQAQGSEHEQVCVLLPEHDTRLATREILYTAITRARRSVLFVGAAARLSRAIRRRVHRDSGVRDALASAGGPSDGQPPARGQD